MVLRHRQRRTDNRVVGLRCKRWSCAACFRRLRYERGRHYAALLGKLDAPPWTGEVTEAAWPTVHKRLRRANASYLKIGQGQQFTVFCTVELPGVRQLTRAEAVQLLLAALLSLTPRQKGKKDTNPITSSRDWKAPRKGPGASDWERVASTKADGPEPVLAVLEKFGIEGQAVAGGGSEWRVEWQAPAGSSQANDGNVYAALARLRGAAPPPGRRAGEGTR
jgi:hypothetical protein